MNGNSSGRPGVTLSNLLYISPPTPEDKPRTASDPTLIFIFGWMDGRLQHVLKYAQAYEKQYPAATLVIISSRSDFWWTSQAKRESLLRPVVDWLSKNDIDLVSGAPNQRILAHAFSNGGCFQLITLASLLTRLRSARNGPVIPVKALVFDSCPGDSSMRSGVAAFTAGISNVITRFLAIPLVWTVLSIFKWVTILSRRPDPFMELAAGMNNSAFFPTTAKRMYIYSTNDQMVRYQAVEGHAKVASDLLGEDAVRVEKYINSPHVSHMKTDPTRYWGAIQKLWIDATQ
jgi:hypothetical protein